MKTVEEWSNAFDTLNAGYARINAFGITSPLAFDEYEKSIYLTKAQEQIVKELYSSSSSNFEDSEKTRRELETLIKQIEYNSSIKLGGVKDNLIHNLYELPEDCWYIVYEQASYGEEGTCINGYIADVHPITHDEYQRVIKNPFRGPSKKRVLRLDSGSNKVELVSNYNIVSYIIRYLSQPDPIVLLDFSNEGLEINGIGISTTCKLHESLHQQILERAVQIAISSRLSKQSNK